MSVNADLKSVNEAEITLRFIHEERLTNTHPICQFELRSFAEASTHLAIFNSVELKSVHTDISCPPSPTGQITFGYVPYDNNNVTITTNLLTLGGMSTKRYLSNTEGQAFASDLPPGHGYGLELKAPEIGPGSPVVAVIANGLPATVDIEVVVQVIVTCRGVAPRFRPVLFRSEASLS